MKEIRKVLLVDAQTGSLVITVECSSLEILEGLWEDYCSGYLNQMAQKFLVTDEILKEFGLIEVTLTTTILEEQYRSCREHFLQRIDGSHAKDKALRKPEILHMDAAELNDVVVSKQRRDDKKTCFPRDLRWNPVPFPPKDQTFRSVGTLYSTEKMDTLFESFQADAHFVLLFLQHLESIELYVREESQSSPKRVFQVKIADESLQIVRTKRKEFRAKITPGKVMAESVTVTYPITIETVKFDSPFDGGMKQHSFLVTNYFCGGEVSSRFKRLMTDKELNYLPTVGVAMALPTGPKLQTPDIKGHVFSFLPLPVQKTA
ncbi:hypothetical protein OS493_010894 [Desmophyllum pertusum]|uniref:TRADD-like N-terminal domain-containing protein n=1 Tax=Desmophyllum pertusum TaxID=174260 RepID=A0A9W9ZGR5_9CNID|nr:hypothetical protein OS493_010894 [Desmophyllum pertusum]